MRPEANPEGNATQRNQNAANAIRDANASQKATASCNATRTTEMPPCRFRGWAWPGVAPEPDASGAAAGRTAASRGPAGAGSPYESTRGLRTDYPFEAK